MRMITKAGLALLAAAAVTGAPTASADQTCIVATTIHVGWVCVDYTTDARADHLTEDPGAQVSCSVFTLVCSFPRLP